MSISDRLESDARRWQQYWDRLSGVGVLDIERAEERDGD